MAAQPLTVTGATGLNLPFCYGRNAHRRWQGWAGKWTRNRRLLGVKTKTPTCTHTHIHKQRNRAKKNTTLCNAQTSWFILRRHCGAENVDLWLAFSWTIDLYTSVGSEPINQSVTYCRQALRGEPRTRTVGSWSSSEAIGSFVGDFLCNFAMPKLFCSQEVKIIVWHR